MYMAVKIWNMAFSMVFWDRSLAWRAARMEIILDGACGGSGAKEMSIHKGKD